MTRKKKKQTDSQTPITAESAALSGAAPAGATPAGATAAGASVAQLRAAIITFDDNEMAHLGDGPEKLYGNYKVMPVALLVKAPWNYKQDNEETAEKLRNNIKERGLIQNLIVRELETGYYEVCNGNHRLDEVIALGITYVVVYDLGMVPTAEAMRVAVETNEIRFQNDYGRLTRLLDELRATYDLEDLVKTMPFTEEQLRGAEELLKMDWNAINGGTSGVGDGSSGEGSDGRRLVLKLGDALLQQWLLWKQMCDKASKSIDDVEAFAIAIDTALGVCDGNSRPIDTNGNYGIIAAAGVEPEASVCQ